MVFRTFCHVVYATKGLSFYDTVLVGMGDSVASQKLFAKVKLPNVLNRFWVLVIWYSDLFRI